jgi:hypothetical protein
LKVSFLVRDKFEVRIKAINAEIGQLKEKLTVAYHAFENIEKGHSFQSVTGIKPAAAERLLPTLADLKGAASLEAQRAASNYADYDSISTITDVTHA